MKKIMKPLMAGWLALSLGHKHPNAGSDNDAFVRDRRRN